MTKAKSFEQLRSRLRADPESRILGEQLEMMAVFPDQSISLTVPGSERAKSGEDSEQKVPVGA